MDSIIKTLLNRFPELRFTAGSRFAWSPETGAVIYNPTSDTPSAIWSLLHETGHALLKHRSYTADIELVTIEVAAWEEAKKLARSLNRTIDENYIQDCLDTYRDWLYRRSICPTCTTKCLQQSDRSHYRCFNCHTVWRVTPSRFCRVYRATKNVASNHPDVVYADEGH